MVTRTRLNVTYTYIVSLVNSGFSPKGLQIFLLKIVVHHIQRRIKLATCFGIKSHHQTLIKKIQKALNTALGARSPPLNIVIHYECN
jgi:hypothetical protein